MKEVEKVVPCQLRHDVRIAQQEESLSIHQENDIGGIDSIYIDWCDLPNLIEALQALIKK